MIGDSNKDINKNSINKDSFIDNFNSITSKTLNLLNLQSNSTDRSKISTIDSLHSKINYKPKDFSELLNNSKEHSNSIGLESINRKNIDITENIEPTFYQLNFYKKFHDNSSPKEINFNKNDKNKYNSYSSKNSFISNLDSNHLRDNNHLLTRSIQNNSDNTQTNFKLASNKIKGNSVLESENNSEDNKLNTIYESCNSHNSDSVLDKILFENEKNKEDFNNNNEVKENYSLNDFQSVESEKQSNLLNDKFLIESIKTTNELRTKILNLNLDFFKIKAKNKLLKVKNVLSVFCNYFYYFYFKNNNFFEVFKIFSFNPSKLNK